MADKMAARNTIIGYNSAIYYYRDFIFFFAELCVMTAYISCKSLTQIRLQIPRWRTKWQVKVTVFIWLTKESLDGVSNSQDGDREIKRRLIGRHNMMTRLW